MSQLNSFAIKEKLDESFLVQLISTRENEYQSTIFAFIHVIWRRKRFLHESLSTAGCKWNNMEIFQYPFCCNTLYVVN